MTTLPLAGRTFRSSSRSDAAPLIRFLLEDMGARVVDVPPEVAADLVDAGHAETGGVALSAYGPHGRFAHGPDHFSAIAAVGGVLMGQYTYAPGPAYVLAPYSSVAQALLATTSLIARTLGDAPAAAHVSGLQGVFGVQTGAYAYGPSADPARWSHTPRGQMPTYATYRCADDWIFVGASTRPFMIKVLLTCGLDDVLADPRTHEGPRALRGTEVEAAMWGRLAAVMRTLPRDEWLRRYEAAGVPAGPVLTLEEALAHPQIAAAGLVEPAEPIGRLKHLVHVARHGDAAARTVPPGPLPLSGVRVVELAGYIAGSYTGRLLADLGASVVKVEPPDGDPFRQTAYGFTAWNFNKRGVSLNLRDASGRGRLLDLVREADILVTNYRPEALARMAVGRDEMFAVNPALIHCTLSAFGEAGPLAHLPGFDPVVQGFAGLQKQQGGDGEPVKSQAAVTDYLSGMLGALGVVAARAMQCEHGGGAVVKTSLLAAALLLNYSAYEEIRAGRRHLTGGADFKGSHPLNGLHQTRDGWLLTAMTDPSGDAASPESLRYLTDGVGHDDLAAALNRLHGLGVPAVPAIDPEALPDEPHVADNGMWVEVDQGELGTVKLPAPVLGPGTGTAHAPAVGEHNEMGRVWE